MLRFELKKVLSKPMNKAALLLLAAVLIIGSILTIRDVTYVEENGNHISGPAAARHLKEDKNKWKGELTEEVFKEVIRENAGINAIGQEDRTLDSEKNDSEKSGSEKSGSEENDSDRIQESNRIYARTQGFSDIRELLNLAFCEMHNYDYYRVDSLSQEDAASFYERRISGLKDWFESEEVKGSFSEQEKQYLIGKYEEMKTPLYYEYADGWKALLDSQYLPTLMMIVVLIIGFLVSGIFSDEFSLKADSIFFSARHGRDRAVVSKMGAGFVLITLLYWGVVLLYSLIVLGALGFGGGECAVQTGLSNWNSIYNISYFQDFLLTVLGGYVGCLFIMTISMLVSAKTHSTIFAITVPFILTCLPPFLGRIEMLTRIMTLFPDQMLTINKNLEDFALYSIGGKIFGAVSVMIPMYVILFTILFPVIYWVYRRAQVK